MFDAQDTGLFKTSACDCRDGVCDCRDDVCDCRDDVCNFTANVVL